MAKTWVNKRLLKADYDINDIIEVGETYSLIADSSEGESYLVNSDDGHYVIKVYKYSMDDVDFCNSIKRIQALSLSTIAKVISCGNVGGHAYEKRVYYENSSLMKHPELLFGVVRDLADVISELHIEGFISLDLKPENIVITKNGAVIVDVGSLLGFRAEDDENLYTPNYCAPEIINGCWREANDFYSLGITLFEMLTGKSPFWGFENATDIQNIKLNPNWWFPPDIVTLSTGKLIYNLINPNAESRWKFGDIQNWLANCDEDALVEDVRQFISRFNGSIQYKQRQIDNSRELLKTIACYWDIDYLFESGAFLSYVDMYLPVRTGFFVANKRGNVNDTEKCEYLLSLYCQFSSSADEIFFNGESYSDLNQFGFALYTAAENLYNNYFKSEEQNIASNKNYQIIALAVKSHCLSLYSSKIYDKQVNARVRIIEKAEQALLNYVTLESVVYNSLMAARAFMNDEKFAINDNNGERVVLSTHEDFKRFLLDNLDSIENSERIFNSFIYETFKTNENGENERAISISPVVMAWNDFYCIINGIEAKLV